MRIRKSLQHVALLLGSWLRLTWSLLRGRPEKDEPDPARPGRHRRKKVRRVPLILAGFLVLGFMSGYGAGLAFVHSVQAFALSGEVSIAAIRLFFGKSIPLAGFAPDNSFVFSDFEREDGIKAWYPIGADFRRSDRYPSQGLYTGHATFRAKAKQSTIILDDLLKSRSGGSDWRKFSSLSFTIFSPVKEEVRLSLQITDLWGKQYRETLKFPGGQGVSFDIPVNKIEGVVTASKIDAISFSMQDEKDDREFYFDDIRLVAKDGSGKSLTQVRQTPGLVRELSSRPVKLFDYGFAQRKNAWTLGQAGPLKEIVRVPFMVRNETPAACRLCPVEGGIPFPPGEVQDLYGLRLRTPAGEEIPMQPKVMATWPDGSVRWLFVHFEDGLGPWKEAGYFLDYGAAVTPHTPDSPLRIREDDESVQVDTGVLRAVLSRERFFLFDKVFVDQNSDSVFDEGELRVSGAQLRLKFKGEEYRTDLSRDDYKLEVEEKGPLRVVIRAEGWFKSEAGGKFCKAIVRYFFYQGKSHVKISHTLLYTGYPENRFYGQYEDLELPVNEPVEMFGLRFPLKAWGENDLVTMRFGRVEARVFETPASQKVRLHQQTGEKSSLNTGEETLESPGTFAGWADVSSQGRGLAVSVRRFRENFPKAFGYDPASSSLDVDLWPEEQGPLDLSTTEKALGPGSAARGSAFGLAKTHEMLLYFHKGDPVETGERMDSFARRLLIRNNPYWVDASGALGRLYPEDSRYQKQEKMLEDLFGWADRHPRYAGWYGMLNFGDTLTWWRAHDDEKQYGTFGWHPAGRWGWYNNEGVGTHSGSLLQFVRTGKWKYFEFGENLARHIYDIDTVHYNTVAEDPRLRDVLSDEFSQPGSMHRHNGDHWGGRNEEASHTNLYGILLYYYLTGDERAWEVSQEVGEFFLKERFTYTGHPDTAPQRGLANALWGSVQMYQATWDDRYKNLADKLIEIFLKGQRSDGSFLENYNPQKDIWWGSPNELYMSWYDVGAFIAYHEMTQDPAVKEMLLNLVRYLAPREYPGPVILHGLAYAYLITHDPAFIELARKNLDALLQSQKDSENPLMDGLIYEKPIYHRPNIFLYTVPYVFGAFEESFVQEQKKAQG